MRVKLAAKVLSETIGNVLNNVRSEEAEVSGQFCIMINKYVFRLFECSKYKGTYY